MDKRTAIASVIIVTGLVLLLVSALAGEPEKQERGFDGHRIIAHAMGGINGHAYTNALEAFVANYEQGTRVFETDLLLTRDHQLVARHEWTANMSKLLGQLNSHPARKTGSVLSHGEFMNSAIMDIYRPLDFDKILDLMQHYKDAYIITDTKEFDSGLILQQFEMIVEAARKRDPVLLDRIVPQIYSRDMLKDVQRVYPFSHIIYTLYQSEDTDQQVIEFVKKHKVDITMPVERANPAFVQSLKRNGAQVYVHTVNDPQGIERLNRMGVDGFYTDFVPEKELKQILEKNTGLLSLMR